MRAESARRAYDPLKQGRCWRLLHGPSPGWATWAKRPRLLAPHEQSAAPTGSPVMGPGYGASQGAPLWEHPRGQRPQPTWPPGLPVMKASSVGLEDPFAVPLTPHLPLPLT